MSKATRQLSGLKIARVSTVAFFIDTQLSVQINAIRESGACVAVVSSDFQLSKPLPGCNYISIKIPRKVSLIHDFLALLKLFRLFHKYRFDIVHSTTPKAGLLCAIAGFAAMIPVRLHTFTGQSWLDFFGFKRWCLVHADKLICRLNTRCYADSVSQKNFLLSNDIASTESLKVLGDGSLAGVDIQRFNKDRFSFSQKAKILKQLEISDSGVMFIFVGRVLKSKGILELIKAFDQVSKIHPDSFLLLVGPQEEDFSDLMTSRFKAMSKNIRFIDNTKEPERYMAVSDVLCIPSYREGFGTVVIEGAAMGLPAIGTAIYGLSDSIEDGKSGLLVEPKNPAKLAKAMLLLIEDSTVRHTMAMYAKKRACALYSSDKINNLVIDEYLALWQAFKLRHEE